MQINGRQRLSRSHRLLHGDEAGMDVDLSSHPLVRPSQPRQQLRRATPRQLQLQLQARGQMLLAVPAQAAVRLADAGAAAAGLLEGLALAAARGLPESRRAMPRQSR